MSHARRLEELRLATQERLAEAELALGRHAEVAAELERLVAGHPLRESLRALQMLALYRSGRQAEALDVFRRARTELVDQFGIEPGSALRAMERAILRQDATLDLEPSGTDEPQAILLVASRDDAFDELVAIRSAASSLARADLGARLTAEEDELASAAASAKAHCRRFSDDARTAVFTSSDWVDDATRLADSYVAQLVLVDAAERIEGEHLAE